MYGDFQICISVPLIKLIKVDEFTGLQDMISDGFLNCTVNI